VKGEGKGRGEEGTGRGPQFEENDPPSSDGWLRAWYVMYVRHPTQTTVLYSRQVTVHDSIHYLSIGDVTRSQKKKIQLKLQISLTAIHTHAKTLRGEKILSPRG